MFLARERGQAAGDSLVEEAAGELRRTLGCAAQPLRAWTQVWEEALPHYRVGHLEGLDALQGRLSQHHGLFVAGASYNGLGVPDCIRSGEEAAERAASLLGAAAVGARAAAALPQGRGAQR